MKKSLLLTILLIIPLLVFGKSFHSVPLDSEAYRIIDIAENRGIIQPQNEVRPYDLDTVSTLLNEISSSDISESERDTINRILDDFEFTYGYMETESFADVLSSGSISFSGSNPMKIGGVATTTQTIGKNEDGKIFDSRNGVMAYVRGDIADVLSYDLNFKVNFDRIDPNAFLPTELLYTTEGFYLNPFEGGDRLKALPDGSFFLGIEAFPELATKIKDIVSIRIGAVKRDWGPGMGNIALSESARVMDGFEFTLTPTSWFSYSVMTASLGLASLKTVNEIPWPSENMDNKTGAYFNNFNIHRVEIGPFSGFKFSIWESVVWRKRFELAYLNPLAIYMFSQNSLGNYDNMLAGFDTSYTIPGIGTIYGAISFDELNSVKNVFSCPRNMLAYQIGGKFSIPVASFSLLQLQATYIPAFYGTHYSKKTDLFGSVDFMIPYVNKGQNIGYPVNPDTLEFLMSFETTVADGWNLSFLAKDQLRSAQYASKQYGNTILTPMDYDAYDNNDRLGDWGYYPKDFFNNIWNNILDLEISSQHRFKEFPISITFGLQGILESARSYVPRMEPGGINSEGYGWSDYYPGEIISWGEWESTFSVNAKVGVSIYY